MCNNDLQQSHCTYSSSSECFIFYSEEKQSLIPVTLVTKLIMLTSFLKREVLISIAIWTATWCPRKGTELKY
jgi:hypothetical protein